METLCLVVYALIALFSMGIVSHFVLNNESGLWMGALGVLISIGLGAFWAFTFAILGLMLCVSVITRMGRRFGRWLDAYTIQWIA
jgi:hypothetical protein